MAELALYNTLTRRKDRLVPLAVNPATGKAMVRLYVCGPTVYDLAHIGNARPVIVFDVLFRLLRHLYGAENVIYARNITDVDDKINARAARDFPGLDLNAAIRKVTEATNARFQADVRALGCLEPTHQPRATEHIGGMIAIINRLIARGHAYVAEGAEGREVLFEVARMPQYGALSRRRLDEQREGARVAVEAHKREPRDFVLWKESAAGEPGWRAEFPTPAGPVVIRGRPGWHIECSAMSMAKLLEPFGGGLSCDDPAKNIFDIHGGGIDLVFPHHENEIAQSCCAFGAPRMANVWMHNGFLQVEGQKMSKSLGNFITIDDLLNTERFGGRYWHGDTLRLAMLRSHYLQPIDWTVDALVEAEKTLARWYEAEWPIGAAPEGVIEALMDDLNTPRAIAAIHTESNEPAREAALRMLGFSCDRPAFFGYDSRQKGIDRVIDDAVVSTLIAARDAARLAKNWAESDRIRDELAAMGIALKDGKDEAGQPVTTWEVKR